MSRPRFTRFGVLAAATVLFAGPAFVGCTNQRLDEAADDAVIGSSVAQPDADGTAAPDTAGPITAGTSPLAGMRGVIPGVKATPAFRAKVLELDPAIDDMAAAAGGYDAVMTIAIAAEVARVDAPGRIADAIGAVTSKGRICINFPRCRTQALQNADLDFDGMTGGIELLANGDPGEATFSAVEYSGTGALIEGDIVNAQAPALGSPPPPPNPLFGPGGDGVLRLGTLLPVLGPRGNSARAALVGIQIAVAELNDANGVLGEPVELVPDESGDGSPGATSTAVGRLVDQRVDAILGGTSYQITGAALAAVTGAGIILFSPTDTARALSVADDRGLFFRVAAPASLQGQVIGTQLANEGYTRVAIATSSADDDRDLAADIAAAVNASGATITATSTVDSDADAARGLFELLGGDPQAIVLTTPTATTAALIRQLTAAGKGPSSLPVYGTTNNMTPELVISLGAG